MVCAALLAGFPAGAGAAPRMPADDTEIVERLPAQPAWRREARRLQQARRVAPRDAEVALRLARGYLAEARESGDARLAGLAEGALAGWRDPAVDPIAVLVMQATLAQYRHAFAHAIALLEVAVRRDPGDAQAWLTLATVHRVGGRLTASDQACAGVWRAGARFHGAACAAENRALRGDRATALAALERLLAAAPDATLRSWLWTTVAGIHDLDARPDRAESA